MTGGRRAAAVAAIAALALAASSCRHQPRIDPEGLKRWPQDVPLYPGADADFGITDLPDVASAGLSTDDDLGKVLEFYRTTLPARGWTLTTVALAPTLPRPMIGARKDRRTVALTAWPGAARETGAALYVVTEPVPTPTARSPLDEEFPADLPLFPGGRCADGMAAMMELRAGKERVRAWYASELPCHGYALVARDDVAGSYLAVKERRSLRVSVGEKQGYAFVRLDLDPRPGAPADEGVPRAWPEDVPLYPVGLADFAYVTRLRAAAPPQEILDFYRKVLVDAGWTVEPASKERPAIHGERGSTDALVLVEEDEGGGPPLVKVTIAP